MVGVHLKLVKDIARIFQSSDSICGSLFGFFKKCKAPKNLFQRARCMGFANYTGDEILYYIKIEEKNQSTSLDNSSGIDL